MQTWKAVASLAQIAVAIAVAFVAYRQYAVAKDKLRLDLFEKRAALWAALEAYIRFLLTALPDDELTFREEDRKYDLAVSSARWLVGPDLQQALRDIHMHAGDLEMWHFSTPNEEDPRRHRVEKGIQMRNAKMRIMDCQEAVAKLFAPYLQFHQPSRWW